MRAPRSFRSRFHLRGGNGNGPSVAGADDVAAGDETHEGIAEALVADAELGAQLRAAEGTPGASKSVEHEGIEIVRHVMLGGNVAGKDSEVDLRLVASDELEPKGIGSCGGAVLDREDKCVLVSSDVEV